MQHRPAAPSHLIWPVGQPYGVRIRRQDGRWYASINYWKPSVVAEDKTHVFGGGDVGQSPLTVDSDLVHYENLSCVP